MGNLSAGMSSLSIFSWQVNKPLSIEAVFEKGELVVRVCLFIPKLVDIDPQLMIVMASASGCILVLSPEGPLMRNIVTKLLALSDS